MQKIKRALISVFDKQGIVEFAKTLQKLGIEIISTGGTANLLQENGIHCLSVADVTGAPEMLDGRVKTLHPKIHGAILARRDIPDHLRQLNEQGIIPIDMVIVNLYPFEQVIQKPGVSLEEAIENIDIGGPTMIRSAAKNYADVAVVTSPNQYPAVMDELVANDGALTLETRQHLASAAFQTTYRYDGIIANYLHGLYAATGYPPHVALSLEKVQDLRYGENPHQTAALYRELGAASGGIPALAQLHGKALSFNNLLDLDTVVKILKSFDSPCSVIVKHNNPCGIAVGEDVDAAFDKALATDPVSAFGGIFGFNRSLELKTAKKLKDIFIEVIVAPAFEPDALQVLSTKKNLRLIQLALNEPLAPELDYKRVAGGFLVQQTDVIAEDFGAMKVVTQRQPTASEWQALQFAWKVVKWVKSNAVIFCQADRTIGIGAGQMSRVDSSILAIEKAQRAGLSVTGTVVASDAFFPFRDGVDAAAAAGATAIIQPGGSVRDNEVIQAADEHRLAMVFTGVRHFRH
ncbi:MAG: bifunctional phosphoribosylaminoimidazolecarboxamide formyltransferase/IMP cyclohydrolase [candidate division KSB1 bacterium]|nr:bifunctional phosphoribosylaminoimidazolecarboxamide formyltransferase/IMP cyclohydrolase [candidate division KSB1 bacterium]